VEQPLVKRTKSLVSSAEDIDQSQSEGRDKEQASTLAPKVSEDDDVWIGARLRELRKDRGLSIQQVADRVGLSIGMISQIERGVSTPSLRSLRLLAEALDVAVSWFFASSKGHSASRHIIRRAQRRRLRVPDVGVVQELLSPDSAITVEIYEVTLEPFGSSGPGSYSHEGEKAGLVIEGEMRLIIGEEVHDLQCGDSFQFPSTKPHRFANPSNAQTRFVWIVANPKRKRR
jgi:transcriptional regulator with XRE-family HTH domain